MHRTLLAGFLALFVFSSAHAGDEAAYAALTGEIVETAILPAYREFDRVSQQQVARMAALCESPDPDALTAARSGFGDLVEAFSAVEFYRFGPARAENRFERLFFWPDRKGRGLRQVQTVIAKQDPTAVDPTQLAGKSVAVQGLLALDFALAGTGSAALAAGTDTHRCRYGQAIANRIATVAGELLSAWQAPDGYAALLRQPAADNPVYRSHAEALQELLRAYSEQMQIVSAFKLVRVVRDAPDAAKPKRAPFWRSGNWLRSVAANLAAVEKVFSQIDFQSHLPDQEAGLADQIVFELEQARRAVAAADTDDKDVRAILGDAARWDRLHYAAIPTDAAAKALSARLPSALGLTLGFNSLDGD